MLLQLNRTRVLLQKWLAVKNDLLRPPSNGGRRAGDWGHPGLEKLVIFHVEPDDGLALHRRKALEALPRNGVEIICAFPHFGFSATLSLKTRQGLPDQDPAPVLAQFIMERQTPESLDVAPEVLCTAIGRYVWTCVRRYPHYAELRAKIASEFVRSRRVLLEARHVMYKGDFIQNVVMVAPPRVLM